MMAEYDDDDEQDILHIDDVTKLYSENNMVRKILFLNRGIANNPAVNIIMFMNCSFIFQSETQKPDNILESNTNRDEWQLELEKVLPRLKVTVKTGIKYFYSTKSTILFKYYLLTKCVCICYCNLLYRFKRLESTSRANETTACKYCDRSKWYKGQLK